MRNRFVPALLALIFIFSACAPRNPGVIPIPSATPGIPTPQDAPLLPPAGALAAQQDLAQALGLPAELVTIGAVEEQDWPDSCLGLGGAAEICAAVITPGFRILLTAGGSEYEYRSNREGDVVRRGENSEPPRLTAKAAALLAEIAGLKLEEIVFVGLEPMDWPNSCLGAEEVDEACAEVITPGYRVKLEFDGRVYVLHTNADASLGRLGGPADLAAALKVRQVAAQEFNTALDTVRLVEVERVEWRNSCLGVEKAGRMCLQVITPGYRVTVEVDGQRVEYHTNDNASAIVR